MNLNDAKDNYYTLSGSLSAVSRQLAFAGIAICWVFVTKEKTGFIINKELINVLLLFVSGLSFDLIQYIYGSAAWGIFHRHKEKKVNEADTFKAPRWINWPTNVFFWGKAVLVIIGYMMLFNFLFRAM